MRSQPLPSPEHTDSDDSEDLNVARYSSEAAFRLVMDQSSIGSVDVKTLCRMESVCKSWRSILTENDEPWKRLMHKRYPRTMHPDVELVEWGEARNLWKSRYRMMHAITQPVLWVDDRPESVRHLSDALEQPAGCNLKVHHQTSTKDAKKWLRTSVESFHDCLRVVTDNHRNEEDEEGNMQSTYEAGHQLIQFMRPLEGNPFERRPWADVPVLVFCGPGSLPYVEYLPETYSRVHVTVYENSVLEFARQAAYSDV